MAPIGALAGLFAAHGDRREVRRRERLHRAGDRMTHAVLVTEGWVGRYRASPSGIDSFTGIHIAGDVVGLDMLTTGAMPDELCALSPGTLMRLPLSSVRDLVEQGGPAALDVAERIAADAGFLREALFAVGTQTSRERVSAFLTQTYCRLRAAGLVTETAEHFPLPLTQSQMGAVTGITGVHINRVLRALRDEGPFDVGSGAVRIIDMAALRRSADAMA